LFHGFVGGRNTCVTLARGHDFVAAMVIEFFILSYRSFSGGLQERTSTLVLIQKDFQKSEGDIPSTSQQQLSIKILILPEHVHVNWQLTEFIFNG
jgi:hypothetical protein